MKTDTWLTPPEIIKAVGPFDFDPCCAPVMPWKTAETMVSLPIDGLAIDWVGRVWLNPPFGREPGKWLDKLARHNNGVALVAARTETIWFYEHVWSRAASVLFLKSRPHFHHLDGSRAKFNSGSPIALVAYGQKNVVSLQNSGLGVVVQWCK